MKNKFNKKNIAGFSLLEIVIVVFIMAIGLVGVISLTTQNLQAQTVNENKLIASGLAQEGIELARNWRDNNWLDSVDWKTGMTGTFSADYLSSKYSVTGLNDNLARLKINASGFYEINSGTNSIFSRIITITDQGDYLNVVCTVRWLSVNSANTYVAETQLYGWQ